MCNKWPPSEVVEVAETVPHVAVTEETNVVTEEGAEQTPADHLDTPPSLLNRVVTAITNMETKLSTASNPSHAPGSRRSLHHNEIPADLAKILITTRCFQQ